MPRTRFLPVIDISIVRSSGGAVSREAISVVEIGGDFAYDGTIFHRILSTHPLFDPIAEKQTPRKGGED